MFRVINTITNEQGRASFLATSNDYDKEDIDSKKRHKDLWLNLHNTYNDDTNEDLNKLAQLTYDNPIFQQTLNRHLNSPADFDQLEMEEFKAVLEYTLAQYKKAMNNKAVSGPSEPGW